MCFSGTWGHWDFRDVTLSFYGTSEMWSLSYRVTGKVPSFIGGLNKTKLIYQVCYVLPDMYMVGMRMFAR